MHNIAPVILCGGSGTRLWPLSRETYPKQFVDLGGGRTLFKDTVLRAQHTPNSIEPVIVCNEAHRFYVTAELYECGVCGKILLEPAPRNTAPAIALAAFALQEGGADPLMLVLPSDHAIGDESAFFEGVKQAAALAEQGYIVTFGIAPTGPETGFGYIEAIQSLGNGRAAQRFVEKPSLEKAKEYIATGNFYWNSGMFCFKAGAILDEMKQHAPEVFSGAMACWGAIKVNQQASVHMLEIPSVEFDQIPDISIDYAVMEHSANVAVVPSDFGWSDIGSWSAVSELVQPDSDNNRAIGDVIFVDSCNTFVQSEDRLVATVGVGNLMIIDTPDALLVAHPDKAQDVKKVVAQLKTRGHHAYKLHRTVARPWGTYTVLEEGPRFKIKRIEVKPGASLSLQMHHHRSEHWIVVGGMAKVVNGEREIFVGTNESTYIPAGHKHRLENPGVLDLVIIEVQSGEYLGEDDIIRFQDDYGRV